MATPEDTPTPNGNDLPAPEPGEAQVRVRFTSAAEVIDELPDEDRLEEDAVAILEAVEQHASDLVLGPVVAWNTDRCEIELEFTVPPVTGSELHRRIALVMQVVEREIPVAREVASETSAELVPA